MPKYARNLLGETPVRENQEGPRRDPRTDTRLRYSLIPSEGGTEGRVVSIDCSGTVMKVQKGCPSPPVPPRPASVSVRCVGWAGGVYGKQLCCYAMLDRFQCSSWTVVQLCSLCLEI